jgi:hypothetical protein
MKTLYIRNTHAPCGEIIKVAGKTNSQRGREFESIGNGAFITHILNSDTAVTFEALVEYCAKYSRDCGDQPLKEEEIALGLCLALSKGFVKAISI